MWPEDDPEKPPKACVDAGGPLADLRADAHARVETLRTLGAMADLLQVVEQRFLALQADNQRLTQRIAALEAEIRRLRAERSS